MPAGTAQVTVANQLTWKVAVDSGTNQCVYPADGGTSGSPVLVSTETKLRFLNTGAIDFVIHGSGPLPHQDPGSPTHAGAAFETFPIASGTARWYCHAPGIDLGAADPSLTAQ